MSFHDENNNSKSKFNNDGFAIPQVLILGIGIALGSSLIHLFKYQKSLKKISKEI